MHRLNHLQHISFFHIVYVHVLVLYTLFIHIQNKVFNIKILSFHIMFFTSFWKMNFHQQKKYSTGRHYFPHNSEKLRNITEIAGLTNNWHVK